MGALPDFVLLHFSRIVGDKGLNMVGSLFFLRSFWFALGHRLASSEILVFVITLIKLFNLVVSLDMNEPLLQAGEEQRGSVVERLRLCRLLRRSLRDALEGCRQ